MATYYFEININGQGSTAAEAWRHACEAFSLDPGTVPEDGDIEVDTSED